MYLGRWRNDSNHLGNMKNKHSDEQRETIFFQNTD